MDEILKSYLLGRITYREYLEKNGFNYTKPQLCTDEVILRKWREDEKKDSYVPIVDYSNITGYRNVSIGEISEYDFYELYEEGIHQRHISMPILTSIDYKNEIYRYAIEQNASDITLYSYDKVVHVQYKIYGITEEVKIKIPFDVFSQVITAMTGEAVNELSWQIGVKDGEYQINENWLGRYNVQKLNQIDLHTTIRLSYTGKFNKRLEDLNLSEEALNFLKNDFIEMQNKEGVALGGLRIICGKPSSGKNWTILAALKLLVEKGIYKSEIIGMPPETVLDGMIPVNCADENIMKKAVEGLNRQAADFGYITEITEVNAVASIISANKGFPIFGTLHCNTPADIVLRFMLITGYTADIVLQSLHSVAHQSLVRDDTLELKRRPVISYIKIDDELRSKCFGKTTGEIYNILKENTKGDV